MGVRWRFEKRKTNEGEVCRFCEKRRRREEEEEEGKEGKRRGSAWAVGCGLERKKKLGKKEGKR